MAKPLVSIVVPCYGVEKYLNRCVESIVHQTLTDIEIILVDDESPDNVPFLCDEWAKIDSRIRVIHKKNGGLGYARNSGLEISSGDYIVFVDSDDFIALNTIEVCYNCIQQHNLDVVYYESSRFTDTEYFGNVIENDKSDLVIYDDRSAFRWLAILPFSNLNGENVNIDKALRLGSAWAGMYRRSLLDKNIIRFYSEKEYLSEDYIFTFELMQVVNRVGFIKNKFYKYFVNLNSLTSKLVMNKIDRAIEFAQKVSSRMIEFGYTKEEAEIHPMKYVIEWTRVQQKIVYRSNLSYYEKRKWFYKYSSLDYIKEIRNKYHFRYLPIKHRINFFLFSHGFWLLSYVFTSLINKINNK